MTICLAQDPKAGFVSLTDAPIRVLLDQILFRRGQRKNNIYHIVAGTIAVYETRDDGTHNVLEFAFAGDTVGFGFLENHVYSARAVGEARVKCLPLSALDETLQRDKRAMQRYAEALQREFEFRRREVLSTDRQPTNRVAALLVALSRRNEEEGRDPRTIDDDCRVAANYLKLDFDALAQSLVKLERTHLIEQCSPNGLRLIDPAGLEQLANEIRQ